MLPALTSFDRVVIRQLLFGVLFVTAVLSGLLWLSQSLRFVDWIVNRGLSPGRFVQLIMLLLPDFLVIILPIAVLATVLFTYSRLTADRELIVMRAAGVSPLGLAKPAIVVAAAATLLAYALYLFVLPASNRQFKELQWDIRYNFSQVLIEEGTFNDFGDGVTVYVRERSGEQELRGILVHDGRDPQKPYTYMAERGALLQGEDGGARVVLFQGSRQQVQKENHSLSILYFGRYAFDVEETRRSPNERSPEPRELPLAELLDVRNDPSVSPTNYGKYLVEAHRRLTAPLGSLGFALIATAFLLRGPFRRGSQAISNLLAVGIALALGLSALGVENVAAREPALVPLMYVVALAPIIAGAAVLAGVRLRRHPPAPVAPVSPGG